METNIFCASFGKVHLAPNHPNLAKTQTELPRTIWRIEKRWSTWESRSIVNTFLSILFFDMLPGSEVLYICYIYIYIFVSLIWSFNVLAGKNRHVFHLVDARNHKLLPGDKQLLHLLAKAQRRSVRYTIVITKIDVCTLDVMNISQTPLLFAWGVI